jgi:hypothetical protein
VRLHLAAVGPIHAAAAAGQLFAVLPPSLAWAPYESLYTRLVSHTRPPAA